MFGPSTGSSGLTMPAADFCLAIPAPCGAGSTAAARQISPGNAHPPSHLCPAHLRLCVPCKYRALMTMAILPHTSALYALPVRWASALPAASFRFHLAMDTLADQLTIPPVGFVGDFHSQVSAPCRAHNGKSAEGSAHSKRSALRLGTFLLFHSDP